MMLETTASRPRYIRRTIEEAERADQLQGATLLMALVIAALLVITTLAAIQLDDRAKAYRALPTAFLCFDQAGNVTEGNNFVNCTHVKYYPPKR